MQDVVRNPEDRFSRIATQMVKLLFEKKKKIKKKKKIYRT